MIGHIPETFYDYIRPSLETSAQARTAKFRAELADRTAREREARREITRTPQYNHAAALESRRIHARRDMAAGGVFSR